MLPAPSKTRRKGAVGCFGANTTSGSIQKPRPHARRGGGEIRYRAAFQRRAVAVWRAPARTACPAASLLLEAAGRGVDKPPARGVRLEFSVTVLPRRCGMENVLKRYRVPFSGPGWCTGLACCRRSFCSAAPAYGAGDRIQGPKPLEGGKYRPPLCGAVRVARPHCFAAGVALGARNGTLPKISLRWYEPRLKTGKRFFKDRACSLLWVRYTNMRHYEKSQS